MTRVTCSRPERAAAARPWDQLAEFRPTSDRAGAKSPARRCACPRAAPWAAATFTDRAAPHGSDFLPPTSGPVCVPGIRRPAGWFTVHAE